MAAREGNENGLLHGGGAARQALSKDAEFTGLARQVELQVRDELELNGRVSIVKRAAIRLQAASDLYWAALAKAGEESDENAINSYTKTFGWLQSKALAAWQILRAEQESDDDGAIEAAVSAAKGDE